MENMNEGGRGMHIAVSHLMNLIFASRVNGCGGDSLELACFCCARREREREKRRKRRHRATRGVSWHGAFQQGAGRARRGFALLVLSAVLAASHNNMSSSSSFSSSPAAAVSNRRKFIPRTLLQFAAAAAHVVDTATAPAWRRWRENWKRDSSWSLEAAASSRRSYAILF